MPRKMPQLLPFKSIIRRGFKIGENSLSIQGSKACFLPGRGSSISC